MDHNVGPKLDQVGLVSAMLDWTGDLNPAPSGDITRITLFFL